MRTEIGNRESGIASPKVEAIRAVALLAIFVFAGCQQPIAAPPLAAVAGAAEPAAAEAIEKVTAAKPVRKSLQFYSTQPARLQAIDETPLHSKLSGYVKQVHVDLGDVVEAGQVLITLDVPEMHIELNQKKALVDQAQAEIRQAEAAEAAAKAAVDTAQAQARQSQAGISRTAADVARWKLEFARLEQLASGGSINKQLVDESKQKLAAAEAAQTEAEAAVQSAQAFEAQAEAGVAKAKADIDAAQAKKRVAEANLQHSQTMLDYAQLKAPYSGVITRRTVDPGHFVLPAGAEMSPLVAVAKTDVIRVFVAIPELEAGLVDLGDTARVQVQSLRNAEFPGVVSRTAWSIDVTSRSLETVIDLENATGRLRPGMYATARILLAERPDVLTLPSAAVVRKDNAAHCFVVQAGQIKQTPIELGIKVGDDWEIAGGLTGNESVCLAKAATLKDGQSVDASPPVEKK